MVVHTCKLGRLRQEAQEFKASLGYMSRPYLKTIIINVVECMHWYFLLF
jgi:hypothetical protein